LESALHWIAFWAPEIISILATLSAVLTTAHIVLHKRDTRSAIGWIGLSWLVPIVGSALYLTLGVNRIRRRAEELRADLTRYEFREETHAASLELTRNEAVSPGDGLGEEVDDSGVDSSESGTRIGKAVAGGEIEAHLPEKAAHLGALVRVVDRVAHRPLLSSNDIEPLFDGEMAYPAMLGAIRAATTSISLSTYIFDRDKWGKIFADALGEAVARGVEVRVLIDAAGLHYSFPSIRGYLRRKKVRMARFLPSLWPPHLMSANLRNHRKILVVDGRVGFTGGMNIRSSHVISEPTKQPTRDLQFRLSGPVVSHLQEAFVDDWAFATGEELRGPTWFPAQAPAGRLFARGLTDGPDEDIDKMPWTLLGAIAAARESIRIVTPYFLPDTSLIDALNVASMRGVRVDVIMPGKNNLPYVQWASFGLMRPLLRYGCRAWLTPPPFDHSKIMVVDRFWMVFGSSNWDPRSHRLNFEFDVECYDGQLAAHLDDWALAKVDEAEQITLAEYDAHGLWRRLRDGAFRLLSPYL
jgi:cardiolipin synthase